MPGPERAWAIYRDRALLLVLVEGEGAIWYPHDPARPALEHPAFSGRFQVEGEAALVELLRRSRTREELERELSSAGLRLEETPVSTLRWAAVPAPLGTRSADSPSRVGPGRLRGTTLPGGAGRPKTR